MPKKTKKEKILAQLHRKMEKYSPDNPPVVKYQNKSHIPARSTLLPKHLFSDNQSTTTVKTTTFATDYTYIKHDLIKITLFTAVALIFQGVLYYLLRG